MLKLLLLAPCMVDITQIGMRVKVDKDVDGHSQCLRIKQNFLFQHKEAIYDCLDNKI